MIDDRTKFVLFIGAHRELSVLALKLRQTVFALPKTRFKFFFGKKVILVGIDQTGDRSLYLVDRRFGLLES